MESGGGSMVGVRVRDSLVYFTYKLTLLACCTEESIYPCGSAGSWFVFVFCFLLFCFLGVGLLWERAFHVSLFRWNSRGAVFCVYFHK